MRSGVALGQKVGKKVMANIVEGVIITEGPIEETDYLAGGFQYKDRELQFFPHAEGYVSIVKEGIGYVFNYTDHLGNVRISYGLDPSSNELKIMEENNYYPFGLKHNNYNIDQRTYFNDELDQLVIDACESCPKEYKYKYNGKELQDELGLNMYAMDVRQYDPAIARWVVQDPVIHESLSPYNAFDNNPAFLSDPSGADSVRNNGVVYGGGHWSDGLRAEHNEKTGTSDNSSESSSNNPPDDITVNSKGIVTNVKKNNKPNRFFDENGTQLFFNDSENDFSDIDSWSKGDRLYFPISSDELAKAVAEAGLDPLMLRVQGKLGEA